MCVGYNDDTSLTLRKDEFAEFWSEHNKNTKTVRGTRTTIGYQFFF